ncbi:MAG TPA: Asp-tRNA(Asn)/Glu-tRNA(Gln) amidotransferase subunit GatA [bacterium]|nr:Asp-tRNA(Asn)/Glu-tRNA(Gln) amidotransferase subunit GatA [bacterium]HPN32178.1 Asp-tRNA(Asn)/Glu-tRNA(Gln) amidotransferase subunit GatA [bacterium]
MTGFKYSIKNINEGLTQKKFSAKELLDDIYKSIEEKNKSINAFITLTKEIAYSQAETIDKKINAGENIGILNGVPIGIKDNICLKNSLTSCGSKILSNFKPPYNATVIEKLMSEGMLFIGKLNMDEFAMGSSTETSFYGATKNPWNLNKIPGGSSGGSAAAVAARLVPVTLGSDTGGSIRQPAALCGVCGIKPTYGRVSRYGLIAYASSLDQIGAFSLTTEDNAYILQAIEGYDRKDSTSANIPVKNYFDFLKNDIKDKKIGIPKEYTGSGLSETMRGIINKACSQFVSEFGCKIVEISLPHTEYAIAAYYILATAEASSNLARYDGVKYGYRTHQYENLVDMYEKTRTEGFGDEVKRRIMLGNYALSAGYYDAYYKKAQKIRTLIKRDFDKAFAECDIILTPTTPATAFNIGEKTNNPIEMYLSDIYTISVNLAGIPAISVPGGFIGGMPAGVQLIGNSFEEEKIYNFAYKFESLNKYYEIDPDEK